MSTPIPSLDEAIRRLEQPFIAPGDWAAILDASLTMVYRGLHDGSIPSTKVGAHFRIPSAWAKRQAGLD